MNRRTFMVSGAALAAALWAPVKAGAATPQNWVTGYGTDDGLFGIARLDGALNATPLLQTDHRLHKVFAHPARAEICAPARRPGTTMLVWRQSQDTLTITAPEGHHYYGHGIFAADGSALYLAENDYETGQGVIGVYDPENDYARVGAYSSGGIGPHDMRLHPDGKHLILANGGLRTHPDTGRAVLNLDALDPSLALIDRHSGTIADQARLPADQSGLSLRHIDVSPDGQVLVGAQNQRIGTDTPALVGLWKPGSAINMLPTGAEGWWGAYRNYIGSVSFDRSGLIAAAASPRGGLVGFWDVANGTPLGSVALKDVCGVADTPETGGFLVTSGQGQAQLLTARASGIVPRHSRKTDLRFDNHCQLV